MAVRYFINGELQGEFPVPEVAEPRTHGAASTEASSDDVTPEKLSASAVEPGSLKALRASRRFLALSIPGCQQCDELGALLAARGVPASAFVKWDKGSPEYPALKKALQAFAGASFTFPQVFAEGEYQGGYDTVRARLEAGAYDDLFEGAFGAAPSSVRRRVEAMPMVVFSLPQCPQCDELRSCLEGRGVPVDKIFVKWDKGKPEYASLKAQLIELTGLRQFTFPQTFVKGEHQGSFEEVAAKLASGTLDAFLAEAFGIAAPTPVAPAEVEIAFDEDF